MSKKSKTTAISVLDSAAKAMESARTQVQKEILAVRRLVPVTLGEWCDAEKEINNTLSKIESTIHQLSDRVVEIEKRVNRIDPGEEKIKAANGGFGSEQLLGRLIDLGRNVANIESKIGRLSDSVSQLAGDISRIQEERESQC